MKKVFIAIALTVLPNAVVATILPENLPVFEADQDLKMDAKLKSWYAMYSTDKSFTKIEDINGIFNVEDKISAYYALILNPELSKNHNMIPSYTDIEKELVRYFDENNKFHPLHDYILSAVTNSNLYSKSYKQKSSRFWNKKNDKSCARRDEIGERLASIKSPLGQKYYVKKLISEIEEYQDAPVKSKVYKKFIGKANKKELRKMAKMLSPTFSNYKSLGYLNKKYLGGVIEDSKSSYSSKLKRQRRKKWCKSAAKTLSAMAEKSEELGMTLEDLIAQGKNVAKCYRRRKDVKRYAGGWDKVGAALKKKFGNEADILAQTEKSRVFWSVDHFEEAKEVIAETLLKYGTKDNKPASLSNTQLMLAQIYENEKRVDDAISNFEVYLQNYPDADPYGALKSLILLNTEKMDWANVIKHSGDLIARQDQLAESERDVSKIGFGLFWGGRAALKFEELELARDYWKRLAVEYYSTYYGALGHYLLETIEGKTLALQPSVNLAFDEGRVLYDPFTEDASVRIDRIKLLLLLGDKKSASCEIKEIENDLVEDEERSNVAKSLLYHAAGNWVNAVQIYGNISRGLRKSLPSGMEKILFPVRYKEDISVLAEKLDLDPFFVISLIRQESLFNPKAYSPAGAIGLMQMLRTTARLEARRLSKSYVENKKEKRSLLNKTRSKWKLFDKDTNLKLGIHHLHSLLKEHGSSVFTLSAYNAGPGRLKIWRNKFDTDDLLLFTEKIPYKETRGYVKLILRNYFYYKKWYGGENVGMPHLNRVISPILADVNESEEFSISKNEKDRKKY